MNDSFDAKQMDEILAKHGRQTSNIIAILQDVQETYRYLPREIFPYLSKELGMTTANIYSHLEYSAKVNSANKIAEKLKLK